MFLAKNLKSHEKCCVREIYKQVDIVHDETRTRLCWQILFSIWIEVLQFAAARVHNCYDP